MGSISMVQAVLYHSDKLKSKGALQLFQKLRELGVVVTAFGSDTEVRDPVEAYVDHPDQLLYRVIADQHRLTISIVEEEGHVLIAGALDYIDVRKNEDVAQVLLKMVEEIMPLFSFIYAYVDRQGTGGTSEKDIKAVKLKTIFWANFFGEPYVEKYGEAFLLGAPGWKTRELADETVEYIITPNLLEAPDTSLEKQIVQYFSSKTKVRRYHGIPF
jgi:hypothetical protein